MHKYSLRRKWFARLQLLIKFMFGWPLRKRRVSPFGHAAYGFIWYLSYWKLFLLLEEWSLMVLSTTILTFKEYSEGIGITSIDRKFRNQIPLAWVLASSSIDQSIHKMDGESMEIHFPKRRQRAGSVCFSANKEGPPLMHGLGQLIPPFPTSTWLSRPPFGVPFISTLSRYSSLVLWNDTQVGNE